MRIGWKLTCWSDMFCAVCGRMVVVPAVGTLRVAGMKPPFVYPFAGFLV